MRSSSRCEPAHACCETEEAFRAAIAPRIVELPVAAVASAPAMLELLLGDVRVRVPSGFDEATLTRVVRALGVAR